MSHFTVLVKINKDKMAKHNHDVQKALEEMLASYNENLDVEFNDKTAEVMEKSQKPIEADSHWGKERPELIGKPLIEAYNSMDDMVEDYFGYTKKDDKYGYMHNPQAKWDWWSLGGRWRGLLPVKDVNQATHGVFGTFGPHETAASTADATKFSNLDVERIDKMMETQINDFWAEYQKWLAVKNAGALEAKENLEIRFSMHGDLVEMGLAKIVKDSEPILDPDGNIAKDENGRDRYTKAEWAYDDLTEEDLRTKFKWRFGFGTYAVLDDDGWKEKGEMGWFGMSSDTLDDRIEWGSNYVDRFLRNEDPDTVIAVVDCHI